MFKNYHIVIFKDREGGFKNLRLKGWGWFGLGLFVVVALLVAGNVYLWNYYTRTKILEHELAEAKKTIQRNDGQLLSLSGKVNSLEGNLARVRQFDAKLRVLMNIGEEANAPSGTDTELDPQKDKNTATPRGAVLLSRHRELFIRHTHSLVEDLTNQVFLEELNQQVLTQFLRDNKDTVLATPSIWPANGFLTSGFGWRSSPTSGASRMHKGLDISNRPGTPIWAPARGVVTFVGMDKAYGLSVLISHGNNITTRYSHLSSAVTKEGQTVERGEVIAAMGNSGLSTGPHLHYEVSIGGVQVDPMRYILN